MGSKNQGPIESIYRREWIGPVLKNEASSGSEGYELNQALAKAQNGDMAAREMLITNYRPFILRVASTVTHHYIIPEHDDEFSVALIAFDEAINSYQPSRSGSFLAFAEMVIRRRLLDHFRRQVKTQHEVPLSGFYSEEEEEEPGFAIVGAQQRYVTQTETENRCLEIDDFQGALARFGIDLAQLAASSPKHCDTRQHLMQLAGAMAKNEKYCLLLEKTKELPYKQLASEFGLTVKTLRRHRAYLIAIYLLKTGDYPLLKDYVNR